MLKLTKADLLDRFGILEVDRDTAGVGPRRRACPRRGRSDVAILQFTARPERRIKREKCDGEAQYGQQTRIKNMLVLSHLR